MSDDPTNIGKQAKDIGEAAKDVAEAAQTSVETVKSFATFLDGVFGNAVSNTWGLMTDKLAYYRFEKAVKLQHEVEERLRKRGVKKRYVPVAFGLPILEKATIEDDETLEEKWANLLANAMDATYDKPLRRNYSSILGDMEAVDVLILNTIAQEHLNKKAQPDQLFSRELLTRNLKLDPAVCENSLRNLMRLGLFKPGIVTGGVSIGDHLVASYKDTELFDITPMGIDFYYAVNDQAK
jgi:hypothetical protein